MSESRMGENRAIKLGLFNIHSCRVKMCDYSSSHSDSFFIDYPNHLPIYFELTT